MPLSLDQYAKFLDGRTDLLWPAAPEVKAVKAKPHIKKISDIRVVTFSIYGTLVALVGGELYLVHPEKFLMEMALEKAIQEFKMWQSMSRKPGKPSEYLAKLYTQDLDQVRIARSAANERYPEVRSDELWQLIVRRLQKNEYQYDAPFYGPMEQFCEKISYFFHTSLQATGPQPNAFEALTELKGKGIILGLIGDAQCFSTVQLGRALAKQGKITTYTELFDPDVSALSYEVGARKPSERLYRKLVAQLAPKRIGPNQVLHVGSNMSLDVIPARRLGFHTALYAGDKVSVVANNDQLNDPTTRPDLLLTDLRQIAQVII
jgi:FMN phosphatase YigB (HAD superfamily)